MILDHLRQLRPDVDALTTEMAAFGAGPARVEGELAERRRKRAAGADAER